MNKTLSQKKDFHSEQVRSILGFTIKRLRKLSKVTQTELAATLGIHQTALCRVESGQQNLTPTQLVIAADFFEVDSDALLFGKVDFNSFANRNKGLLVLPDKYESLLHSKFREVLPVLLFLNRKHSTRISNLLLKNLKLQKLNFVDVDSTISAHCLVDLLNEGFEKDWIRMPDVSAVAECFRDESVSGFLHKLYQSHTDSFALVQTLILNFHQYDRNFLYKLEKLKPDSFEVSITPLEHMKKTGFKNESIGKWICSYKKTLLKDFPKYIGKAPLKVSEHECLYEGRSRCIYKFTY